MVPKIVNYILWVAVPVYYITTLQLDETSFSVARWRNSVCSNWFVLNWFVIDVIDVVVNGLVTVCSDISVFRFTQIRPDQLVLC